MVKIQCELAIDSMHHVVILVKLVSSEFTFQTVSLALYYIYCCW